MSLSSKFALTLALLAALCFAAPAVRADTVIIGGSDSLNAFPFGVFSPSGSQIFYRGEYQQFYAPTRFTSPVTITQIAFASNGGGPRTFNYNLAVGLGTAAAISTNFAANRGPDFTTVFTGNLTSVQSGTGSFDLVINLTTPFTFDPSGPPLLLEVVMFSSATSSGDPFQGFTAGTSVDVARVFNFLGDPAQGSRGQGNFGLLTRFTFTPAQVTAVPEPTTMLLLGTGLAGVASRVRKRRQTA